MLLANRIAVRFQQNSNIAAKHFLVNDKINEIDIIEITMAIQTPGVKQVKCKNMGREPGLIRATIVAKSTNPRHCVIL